MIVLLYTILHFVVDGLCSFIIFNNKYDNFILAFAIYNFLAFILQPFIGLFIDNNKNHKLFLTISVLFILLGILLNNIGYITLVFLGIGNAFFHIAGGYEVTRISNNDIRYLGIFVSTGVIGITITKFNKSSVLFIILCILLIFIYILIMLNEYIFIKLNINDVNKKENINLNINDNYRLNNRDIIFVILNLLIIVFIRSYLGATLKFDTVSNVSLLLISIFIALGKALGGFIYKFFGCTKSIIISFVISSTCLIYINDLLLYLILILLFNISMPITLYFINIILKNHFGFAFGLLASVLVPGYILSLISFGDINYKILFFTLNLLSSILIIISYNVINKNYV